MIEFVAQDIWPAMYIIRRNKYVDVFAMPAGDMLTSNKRSALL
jgi:hypothetical protein